MNTRDNNRKPHHKKKKTTSQKNYSNKQNVQKQKHTLGNYGNSHGQNNRRQYNHQSSKKGLGPKLTRISTDPGFGGQHGTMVSIPSLMQTNTHLTPIENAATLSPAQSPNTVGAVTSSAAPAFPNVYNYVVPTKRANISKANSAPQHLKRKPLPPAPAPTRNNAMTYEFIPKALPSSKSMMHIESSKDKNTGSTTTTTTTITTYSVFNIDSDAGNRKKRIHSTGKLTFSPPKQTKQPLKQQQQQQYIPTFIPLGTTQNELKQMQFSYKNNNNSTNSKNNNNFTYISYNNNNKNKNNHKNKNNRPGGNYNNNINIYNTGNNNNNNDEYDIPYDEYDEYDDIVEEKHHQRNRSKTQETGNNHNNYNNENTNNNKQRRRSDSEVVSPRSSSPYHPNNPNNPNNHVTFSMYGAKKSQENKPKTRSKTVYNMPRPPKRIHAKSTAIPPPHIPKNLSPKKNASFDPKHTTTTNPFPAPFIPPPPPPPPPPPAPPATWKNTNKNEKKPIFDLQQILLPGQDSKNTLTLTETSYDVQYDDSDDESPLLPEPHTYNATTVINQVNLPPMDNNNNNYNYNYNKKKVRRNSDTIVYTPTNASVIGDSTFIQQITKAPQTRMHHYRARLKDMHADAYELQKNLEDASNATNGSSDTPDSMINNCFSQHDHEELSVSSDHNNHNNHNNLNDVVHEKHNLSLVDEIASNNINVILPFDGNKRIGRRRNSAPETPTPRSTRSGFSSTPSAPDMDNAMFYQQLPLDGSKSRQRKFFPPMTKNSSVLHNTNKQLIDKLLGFATHAWNFDNQYVNIYFQQCKNVRYERFVPSLMDILYPTMLSSLALPAQSKSINVRYYVSVKYNLSSFVSVEENIAKHSPVVNTKETIYVIEFNFTYKTTIRMAIEEITHKIKANHSKYSDYIRKLHMKCFVLKVCGREEYIKVDDKNNKLISLSYIRNHIRTNQIKDMELVLLYDDSLNKLNDLNMRKALRNSYNRYYSSMQEEKNNTNNVLEYENLGFNVITDTLYNSINKDNLHGLNTAIEEELLWLQHKIGSVYNSGDETAVANIYTPVTNIYSTYTSEINEFEWHEVNKDAVLLPEFEHPIEFRIESLSNIMLCPRFRMRNNEYFVYVLRIELMFGIHVFPQVSWDITIPKQKISNDIQMPREFCTFSTSKCGFNYASLPREAVWCFTLYGIKKDEEIAKELQDKKKKQDKKKRKKEPKILRAFIKKQATVKSIGGLTTLGDIGAAYKASYNNNNNNIYSHISSKAISQDFENMIGNELINDFYSGYEVKNNNRRSTMRTTMRSMNEYMLNEKDENDAKYNKNKQYTSEAMAWCRLPMIDHKHCLRKGRLKLQMWIVEVFEKVKGGPKIDPYTTGMWKKFGSIRDCNLRKKTTLNSVVLSINFLLNKYKFAVVAPIVNQRRPHWISNKIKVNKKKDYSGKGVLANIITRDGIFPMDERDKLLVYSNKEKLMRDPSTIPTFLRSVSWLDQESRMEAYDYLERWNSPKDNPEDMIELLRYEFADNRIRLYAVNCLNQLDDFALNRCLLQLVQALKNETHHSSFLSRFLIMRALKNPFQIGHYLFWHLKSEYHDNNLQFVERYGVLLAEYLLHLPYYPLQTNINLAKQLCDENNLINRLKFISLTIKNAKAKKKWSNKNLTNLLQNELMRLNTEFFNKSSGSEITLPLNPSYKVSRIQFDRCRFMSSAKVPLWLEFDSADRYYNKSISVMFKCGDDLRQDILTLQLISIMDAFWLSEGIDLNMRTYEVIGTGYQVGMVELVLNSKTTNDINKSLLGGNKSHYKYINNKTSINKHLSLAQKTSNYIRSVAGFSIATWTLGIGDRHPDNIMIHQDGTLFHIDFGHFLGNFKEKDIGGLVKWKREKTPFVFTNAMKYCIEKDSKQSFTEFVKWLFNAYCEIRVRYKFFVNLLLLMVPSQMPELITESDVSFFREILRFDLVDAESIASHVESTLKLCLDDKNKRIDDMFHRIAHM